MKQQTKLLKTEEGLALVSDELKLIGDYSSLLPRVSNNRVHGEMLVKAVRIKGQTDLFVLDGTAGLGEDSFLLAAAGNRVLLCEYNDVIYSLLEDTHHRALLDERLTEIAKRMELYHGDSMSLMLDWAKGNCPLGNERKTPDVILLDPMFPAKTKHSLTNKKLQLFQSLESPCRTGEELFEAAMALKPKKIVVKRPLKGECLASRKPGYSISGKTVRFDCYVF